MSANVFIPLKSREFVDQAEATTLARECVDHGYGAGSPRRENRLLVSLPAGPEVNNAFGNEGDVFFVMKRAINRFSENVPERRLIVPDEWGLHFIPEEDDFIGGDEFDPAS